MARENTVNSGEASGSNVSSNSPLGTPERPLSANVSTKRIPSYALPTRSSRLKSDPGSSKCSKTTSAHTHKRYSSLEPLEIKAADRSKPCPFASLPTEIRLQIYSYVPPDPPVSIKPLRSLRPLRTFRPLRSLTSITSVMLFRGSKYLSCIREHTLLFEICRFIQAETMYEFFRTAKISFYVRLDDYEVITDWITAVPPAQRMALAKNPNIKINFYLHNPAIHREDISKICYRFGNTDAVQRPHWPYFARFCLLASWCLACAELTSNNIIWTYNVVAPYGWEQSGVPPSHVWFKEVLQTVTLPCVQAAWLKNRQERKLKEEWLRLVEAVDRAVQLRRIRDPTSEPTKAWNRDVDSLRQFLRK